MPGKHSAKEKRMAKHIIASCNDTVKACQRMAWATVNKRRSNKRKKGKKHG